MLGDVAQQEHDNEWCAVAPRAAAVVEQLKKQSKSTTSHPEKWIHREREIEIVRKRSIESYNDARVKWSARPRLNSALNFQPMQKG